MMSASLLDTRERLARAYAARRAEAEPLVRAVRMRLPTAGAALRAQFGAHRVLLFGSFASGTPMARSDVDIAVEGIAGPDQFRAMALLSQLLEHTVDLVRLEDLGERDRARIERDAEPV